MDALVEIGGCSSQWNLRRRITTKNAAIFQAGPKVKKFEREEISRMLAMQVYRTGPDDLVLTDWFRSKERQTLSVLNCLSQVERNVDLGLILDTTSGRMYRIVWRRQIAFIYRL